MNGQLYPIHNGDVTLYVRQSGYSGTQYEFVGIKVADDDNFYMPHVSHFNAYIPEKVPCVGLSEMLFEHYKALADTQLQDYLDRHLNDALDPEAFKQFWHQAGVLPKMKHNKNLNLERVIDGLIGIEINSTICFYNLAAHEPAGYQERYHSEQDVATTPLRVFYDNYLQQLLALEQNKRGLAPPVYTALARLNEFLAGKRSLKFVMKDGAVHELKPHYSGDVTLHQLLRYEPQAAMPFSLNNSYDCKPQLGRDRPLTDLDYLQYGKQRFVIDAAALSGFERKEAEAA
jgi:hypothetical protein